MNRGRAKLQARRDLSGINASLRTVINIRKLSSIGDSKSERLRNITVSVNEARMRRLDRWPELRSARMEGRQLWPVAGVLTPTTVLRFSQICIKVVDKAEICGNISQLLRLQYDVGPDIGRGCW
jgi:hypothetical protein